jgi:hypothetical protein
LGQWDILIYLREQRRSGNEDYFSGEQIRKKLLERGVEIKQQIIYSQINKLLRFNYLEARTVMEKQQRFKGCFQMRTILKYRAQKK